MILQQKSDISINSAQGLTKAEVEVRIRRGEINIVAERTSRTYSEILHANIFTLFNAILGVCLALILIFGSIKDSFFGLVLIINPLIGIIQETRAKVMLDRLALLKPKVHALRDGQILEIATETIVLDDVIELNTGDQVIVDGKVLISESLEVDESLLSGESMAIKKKQNDKIYSGSFVVAGTGKFKVTQVGTQTFAQKLMTEARQFTLTQSELVSGINKFLRYIIWAMVIITPLLFITQYRAFGSIRNAFPVAVAGLVGMVPQGLVLLTSIAFAVSVIRLSRRKVLVQQLSAVEALARVDILCFDKTGTLTKNELVFHSLEKLDQQCNIESVLRSFGAISSPNATLLALATAFPANKQTTVKTIVPFSSERKWSAISFNKEQIWILGAPEVLIGELSNQQFLLPKVAAWAEAGYRVLLLGYTKELITSGELPDEFLPITFLLFEEQIREDAQATLEYFEKQNITIKIISGDNPKTVASVSTRVGLTGFGEAIDARNLPEDLEQLSQIMEKHSVFGRVKPQQKREMVKALQAKGHVVAMTGDGVNDVLAIKEAILGIAMGNGAAATKAVAEIVLLDSKFSTLPLVMAEGRKVVANIERVANLFLTKTVYITLLVVSVGSFFWPFPFLPRHLMLIDGLTIGIPSFFLALAPNTRRYRPGFTRRVLHFVIPAGLIAAAATFATYWITRIQVADHSEQSTTAALFALILVGFWVLSILSRPLTFWRKVLLSSMLGFFVIVISFPWTRMFLALEIPSFLILSETVLITAIFIGSLEFLIRSSKNLGS